MKGFREEFESKGVRFVIRNPEVSDAAELMKAMRMVDEETVFLSRDPGEFDKSFTLEKEEAFLAAKAENECDNFLIAVTKSGEVAASCACAFDDSRMRARHVATIAVSVRKDFWRMGLGKRFFELQEKWCRENGIEKIKLEVVTENTRALGLYLSCGFVIEGTLRHEAKLADGTYQDHYLMAKLLN